MTQTTKPAAAKRRRLTALSVAQLKGHPDRVVTYWDLGLPCFGVAVTPNGARSYIVLTRVLRAGKKTVVRKVVGRAGGPDGMDLAEARERAGAWLRAARDNEDFTTAIKAAEAEAVEASKATFAALVEDFLDKRSTKLRPRVLEEYTRTLHRARDGWDGLDVAGWGPRPVATITKRDVRQLVEAIEDAKQQPAAAFHARAVLAVFFGWCKDKRDALTINPCDGVEVEPIASRERFLSPEELADLLPSVDAAGPLFADFVRVLLLTAQRRSEVAGMRWSELDNVHAPTTWTLPPERTKNGCEHVVPLSTAAARIIARQQRKGTSDFVFSTSKRNPKAKGEIESASTKQNNKAKTPAAPTALAGFNKRKAAIAAAIDKRRAERGAAPMPQWQLHDFRRTFATLAGELEDIRPHVRAQRAERILAGLVRAGVEVTPAIRQMVTLQAGDGAIAPHVVDAALNHVEGKAGARSGVAGVYNRARYLEDARVALEAWGRWIESISPAPADVMPGNVVPLRGARA